jgi:hypothetical protein
LRTQRLADRTMTALSATNVVDPPGGISNILLAQSVASEHFRIEELPSFGSFTVLETAC